uniref:Uncharacterized protein n=1 Tax=Tanacetum cinerariifolium TaxID=118510 RepID=A0A699GZW3_TANCI|nr:hypothetical protein [Tanacetum cinerariifolium]
MKMTMIWYVRCGHLSWSISTTFVPEKLLEVINTLSEAVQRVLSSFRSPLMQSTQEILDDGLNQSAICSFFVWYSRFKLTSCVAAVNTVSIRNFKKEFANAFDGPVTVHTAK